MKEKNKILSRKNISVAIRFFRRSLLINLATMMFPFLLVSVYCMVHIYQECTYNFEQNSSLILTQADRVLEEFYEGIDSAYLILSTDSDINRLLRSLFEEEVSLENIRFAEILSANFRNTIFTDDYIQNIYFYLNNDENRVLTTINKRVTKLDDGEFAHIGEALMQEGGDVWMELYDSPPIDIGRSNPTMQIYRRLYYRATRKQSGLVVYSIDMEKLSRGFEEHFVYGGQEMLLLKPEGKIFWSSVPFGEQDIATVETCVQEEGFESGIIMLGNVRYQAAIRKSPRSYGLSCMLLTPVDDVYRTAIEFMKIFILVIGIIVLGTVLAAYYRTKKEYGRVRKTIDIFAHPHDMGKINGGDRSRDPFSYIQMNVIRLFMEQDYLKMRDLQKSTQLQLSRIKALQHQINPHFMNNTLNVIYWEAIRLGGGENECSRMIQLLSDFMRYSLSDPQEDVPLYEEISFLKKYVELMQKRYNQQFDMVCDIAPDCGEVLLKKLLLQPIVENAINHGLRKKEGRGEIRITALKKEGAVLLSVRDDGVGMSEEQVEALNAVLHSDGSEDVENAGGDGISSEHIGLKNTNARLRLAYGEESGLRIESKEGAYTEVSFCMR